MGQGDMHGVAVFVDQCLMHYAAAIGQPAPCIAGAILCRISGDAELSAGGLGCLAIGLGCCAQAAVMCS